MSYASRIMKLRGYQWASSDYHTGHRVARHAAAEIASEAEGEIENLKGQLSATQSLLDKAMTLIPEPEDLEYLITLARNAPHKTPGEHKLIEKFERLWGKL